MAFKFENLNVWKNSMDLNDLIFTLSKKFPNDEKYNLTSQIRRAADSISLNIAEGSTSQSNPEFSKFLGYAVRSLVEVVCALFIARRRNYISEEEFQKTYGFCEDLVKRIQTLKQKIN